MDFVRYLLGVPDSLKSEVTTIGGNREHIFSLYKYANAVISIEGGWDYPSGVPFEMEYRVKFEKATVMFNSSRVPSLMVYNQDGTALQPVPVPDMECSTESKNLGGNISSLGGYYNEIKYFLECLKNGEEIKTAPLEEGIESLRLTLKEISVSSLHASCKSSAPNLTYCTINGNMI